MVGVTGVDTLGLAIITTVGDIAIRRATGAGTGTGKQEEKGSVEGRQMAPDGMKKGETVRLRQEVMTTGMTGI